MLTGQIRTKTLHVTALARHACEQEDMSSLP
jgi:hypothetical protein